MFANTSDEETSRMSIIQKPVNTKIVGITFQSAAWKEKPSWYLIAKQDKVIPATTQLMMAKRIPIIGVDTNQAPLVSKPEEMVDFILKATQTVA